VPIVAGVDFGTLSVRVTLLDSDPEKGKPEKGKRDSSGKPRGRLGTATAEYPLHRRRDDPDFATQSHDDQMDALVKAMRAALEQTEVRGGDVVALALDTTGSSVVPVDAQMQPLSEYYLWCDHRAKKEAQQITALAHAEGLEAIQWCGGVYSPRVGLRQAITFSAEQSGQAGGLRQRLRTLRHGCRDASAASPIRRR